MKKTLFLILGALLFGSCENETTGLNNKAVDTLENERSNEEIRNSASVQYFLVANRGSSSVNVFNANTTEFLNEISLPDENAQPTYLAYSKRNNAVYIGDFSNKKVVYYDANSFEFKGEIGIEEGAFHMWANDFVQQLWVNNIVSKITSIIDLKTNTVIKNIPLPIENIPELTENAVQHDVVISKSGSEAYVTVLDGPDKSYVVQYDTKTLEYINHQVVGGDSHLLDTGFALYVPTQNENQLNLFRGGSLTKIGQIPFESTHGITNSRRYVFTTGIATNTVGVIDRFKNIIVSEIDTEFNTPHNLAINRKGDILFLSHSGSTATKVVFYRVEIDGTLEKLSDYDSGLNPFGVLAY